MANTEVGILKHIGKIFYRDNTINYKAIALTASVIVIGGYCLKLIVKKNRERRVAFNKLYYKTHVDTLKYINILLRVHVPLSINSIFIISHLRYLKNKGEPLDYNDIKSGYMYGVLNFILSAWIINKPLNYYVYDSASGGKIIQQFTKFVFNKFILSPVESQLINEMIEINKILSEALGDGVENIKDLENIIWQYIGPIDDAVDYTEFKDIINYVQCLKTEFVNEQKVFVFERYLFERAINMFDYRMVTQLSIWKMNSKYGKNEVIILFNVCAQIIVYIARLFGKMILSQIWYLAILELSGNHDLLDQYLYSLMSREPLYLMIGLPFFILRFTRFRADLVSGKLKDWIVVNVKEITHKVFGTEGFVNP